MPAPDMINATFEVFGGLAILGHIRQILKDKCVRGVALPSVIFFTLWGLWNLYYYPHLGQWLSFFGGLVITLGNAVWIALLIRFRKAAPA